MHVIIAVSAKAHAKVSGRVGAAQARTGARQLLKSAAAATVARSFAARCSSVPVVRCVAVQPAVALERDAARCDAQLGALVLEVALL
jgi:hypothetical protein